MKDTISRVNRLTDDYSEAYTFGEFERADAIYYELCDIAEFSDNEEAALRAQEMIKRLDRDGFLNDY